MILGRFEIGAGALMPIQLRRADGGWQSLEAIVDTGFDGFLSLGSAELAALALTRTDVAAVTLAGDIGVRAPVYGAAARWDGCERQIDIVQFDGPPMLGLSLLYGYELRIEIVRDGQVTVTALS